MEAEWNWDPEKHFEVGPGHNEWVAGDKMCVALDVAVRPADHNNHRF